MQIVFGFIHSGAIIDGNLYMWGNNVYGQLGLGNSGSGTDKNTPTKVETPGTVTQLALGTNHSGAIIGGELYMWGWNYYGQLGTGNNDLMFIPTKVDKIQTLDGTKPPIKKDSIAELVLGNNHSGAIIDGKLYMWGDNSYGQLGIGDNSGDGASKNIPREVSLTYLVTPGLVTQLALGSDYSGGIIDGKLYMWGRNTYGKLGLNISGNALAPWELKTPGTVTQLALGTDHSGAIIDGELYMWGRNNRGQLGNGNNEQKNELTKVITPGTVTQLALGESHSGAIIDGNLYMWGNNKFGQLGLGNSGDDTERNTPIKVDKIQTIDGVNTAITPETVTQLVLLGGNHSGAIIGDKLYTWGRGDSGQLGLGDKSQISINTPTKVEAWPKIIEKNLDLTNDNDPSKLRNDIAYNIDAAELEEFIKKQSTTIGIPTADRYTISDRKSIGKVDTEGQIYTKIFTLPSNTTINLTLKGFKPVNETKDTKIEEKEIPLGDKTFTDLEMNQLVADAINDKSGTTSTLAKWIIKNSNKIIGDTTAQYNENFPKDAKITKVTDFEIADATQGKIRFKIEVDKYYKSLLVTNNLVESEASDPLMSLDNPITLSGFKATATLENTSIKIKDDFNKDILSGDLPKLFGYVNDNTPIDIEKYFNVLHGVPGATYTMQNLDFSIPGKLSLIITASDHLADSKPAGIKSFLITIDGLKIVKDSAITQKTTIAGDGEEIAKNIDTNITKGKEISVNDPLLNQLVDIQSYPPNTKFTIDNITKTDKNIFKTYSIQLSASQYYKDQTTLENQATQPIDINNLQFTPTTTPTRTNKEFGVEPSKSEFATLIEYDENTSTFNATILQEYFTLKGFDLITPGATKMETLLIDPGTKQINFKLAVTHYVGDDGIGVDGLRTYNVSLPWNPIVAIPPVVEDQVGATSDAIIWASSIVGSLLFLILLILLTALLIHKKRNQVNKYMVVNRDNKIDKDPTDLFNDIWKDEKTKEENEKNS